MNERDLQLWFYLGLFTCMCCIISMKHEVILHKIKIFNKLFDCKRWVTSIFPHFSLKEQNNYSFFYAVIPGLTNGAERRQNSEVQEGFRGAFILDDVFYTHDLGPTKHCLLERVPKEIDRQFL